MQIRNFRQHGACSGEEKLIILAYLHALLPKLFLCDYLSITMLLLTSIIENFNKIQGNQ